MDIQIVENCRDNEALRAEFNALTRRTFDFDFIHWYNGGFWGEKYTPHCLLADGKLVANVSANLMDFTIDGEKRRYIQIGTVMTDGAHRNQGYGRRLMEYVIEKYRRDCDGIYLFANDSAVDYYPKFGFVKGGEFVCTREINTAAVDFVPIADPTEAQVRRYLDVAGHMAAYDRMVMDNYGLMGFWTGRMDGLYYSSSLDAYAVADVDERHLFLNCVISEKPVDLNRVIDCFGGLADTVELGFTPVDVSGFRVLPYHEPDCTLFIMGEDLNRIERDKLRFPTLSHA